MVDDLDLVRELYEPLLPKINTNLFVAEKLLEIIEKKTISFYSDGSLPLDVGLISEKLHSEHVRNEGVTLGGNLNSKAEYYLEAITHSLYIT